MDFRNKYLKYKPEITFDIFQEIWDKLISFGYRPFNDSTSIKRYNEFKNSYCFLNTTKDHLMEFSCYFGVADSFSETTVQEILGYDPFVKDNDFVLPEKWCCKITEESIEIFNNWRMSMSKHYLQKEIDKKYPYIINDGGCNYTAMGTEITFYQFKKYVLKHGVEESKEVIPEYVECVSWFGNSFTPSKIYKVVNGKVKDNDGYHKITDWNHVDFKPSSKSAFVKMIENELKTLLNL